VYWLFDVLQIAERDVTHHSYFERFTMLTDELEPGLSEPVRVLESALTTKQKRGLYERLQQSSAEGIVFKHKDAPYTPGRGSTQLKCKFVSSADVVLVENAGNAYRMQVYDGGKLFDVGKVFSGTTNETRKEIDAALSKGKRLIAEVRYLYATDDSQLFQPIFVRVRTDKKEKDCVRAQLKATNREVVDGDGEG
jgi:ATP-dependent DNA ligase